MVTASEIHGEIMTMTYTDPSAVASALEHIAELLCEFERRIEALDSSKEDRPNDPRERAVGATK